MTEFIPIAIVGMACRLPGDIRSPRDLWSYLKAGRSANTEIPKNRFKIGSWYHQNGQRPGSVNARGGYFLDHGDSYRHFDPRFFGISATEALSMDPQQRKLCEVVYESFESAGITLDEISGSQTGCFVGNFTMDAAFDQWKDIEYVQPYQTTGSGLTILSNRINYIFNLKGPSFTIDTACSSTMYALHYACSSLRNGECSAAVVGGTNLIFGLEQHIGSVALGALSPTSTCHTFDASADGYGRADAVGAFVLKRLPDAIANGDKIRAVIRGTAVNANGRSSGISHPSTHQQEAVIRAAYAQAQLPLHDTGYFECHGTGTPVGDPIEVSAIGRVFASYHSRDDPLYMGSVKTNLGHGEAASAIASIMKSILVLETGQIPPSVGIETFNPLLDFRDGALHVCQSPTPWTSTGRQYRRASVNSFGYGGANAHAVIDSTESFFHNFPSYIQNLDHRLLDTMTIYVQSAPSQVYLLPFSAHNEDVLKRMVEEVSTCEATESLEDLAFTLSAKRSHFANRAFLLTDSLNKDPKLDIGNIKYASSIAKAPTIVFVFTGQGATWSQMGLTLIDQFPVVRSTLESLDRALAASENPPEWSITDILRQPEACSRIAETDKSQTTCTALQIALVDLLKSWGISALGVVGHSSGEIAASYAAGLTTADEAIRIAYYRGIAASVKQQAGAMLAVGMSLEEIKSHLEQRKETDVVVACHNSPRSVTLSGPAQAIDEVAASLMSSGTFVRKLRTDNNAYHSPLMAGPGQEYLSLLRKSTADESARRKLSHASMAGDRRALMVSSVTNEVLTGVIPDAYWQQNLVSRVNFSEALGTLLDTMPSIDHVLELGPHGALASPIRDIAASRSAQLTYLPTLTRRSDCTKDVLNLAGNLYLKNYPLDLATVNGFGRTSLRDERIGRTVRQCRLLSTLPAYPWVYKDQDKLWKTSRLCDDVKFRSFPRHDLLGSKLPGSSPSNPSWRNVLRVQDVPWLEDHRIADEIVFPAAGYVAMAVEAASQVLAPDHTTQLTTAIDRLSIHSAVRLQKDGSVELVTDGWLSGPELNISIKSVAANAWTEHASVVVRRITLNLGSLSAPKDASVGGRWGINADSHCKMWSDAMRRLGMDYGPSFTILSDITARSKTGEAAAKVSLQGTAGTMVDESKYILHPTAIDAAFQLIVMAVYEGQPHAFTKAYIPTAIRDFCVQHDQSFAGLSTASIRVTSERRNERQVIGRARILKDDGQVILEMSVELTSLETKPVESERSLANHPYNRLIWEPDFERLTTSQIQRLLPYRQNPQTVKWHFERLEEMCVLILLNDWRRVPTGAARHSLSPHIQRYVSWVEAQGRQLSKSHPLSRLTDDSRESRIAEIVQEMDGSLPELALIARLHNHLLDIVFERVGALDVMVQDGLLSKVYEDGFSGQGAYDKLAGVLRLMSHKNPGMRILEVGAGSGGATKPALDALEGNSSFPRYLEYVFTDLSTAFLSRAQDKFRDYKRLSFSILDIEKHDLVFEDQTFDLIIASNVIHATESIVETLSNCKQLLRPHGRLIMIETTQIRLVTGLLVGQLPGYWLGVNDGRKDGPFISDGEWDKRLLAAGFFGADHVLYDYEQPYNSTSVIISRHLDETEGLERIYSPMASDSFQGVYLIYLTDAHALLSQLESQYKLHGVVTCKMRLDQTHEITTPSARTIILIELETAALFNMAPVVLEGLQRLIATSTSAVWVTNAGMLRGEVPEKCLVTGLVKSITIEEPSFRVATVDFSPETLDWSLERAAKQIYEIENEFSRDPDTEEDHNFAERDGVLHISRNISEERENADFRRMYSNDIQPQPWQADMRALFGRTGDLKTMYWDWKATCVLGEDEVLVEARSFTLDKYAIATLRGEKNWPRDNIEVTGHVKSVGNSVQNCKVGDRVLCFGPPWLETTFVVHHSRCFVLNAVEAPVEYALESTGSHHPPKRSSIPTHDAFQGQYKQLCLAWHMCHELGVHVDKKHILVDLPGDTFGHALSQIALLSGASVTASHTGGRDHFALHNIAGLEVCKRQNLHGSTFDVVITKQDGETARSDVRRGGQIVIVSDRHAESSMSTRLPARDISLLRIDIGDMIEEESEVLFSYIKSIHTLASNGTLEPLPRQSFPVSEIDTAAHAAESQGSYGAVNLTAVDNDMVMVRQRPKPLQFKADAAYLLVGGLGGLGRVITMWMISRGARNLIFLSRSAADKPEAASLVKELDELAREDHPDLRIQVVRGDVSCAADVERAVKSASAPIRGVIHAAMVLKESLFSAMTVDVWDQVVRPKVRGARNLHEHTLGMDLDFFVLTSTILSVVGAATQSNYAAANAYLDYLARHRHHRGMQATSLSIGMVVNVGYVEEHEASETALRRNGMYGIDMTEFLHNLELACRRKDMSKPANMLDACATSNIITGMDPARITRNSSKTIWQRDARLRHFLRALDDLSQASIAKRRSNTTNGKPDKVKAVLDKVQERGTTALRDLVTGVLVDKIAHFVMLNVNEIEPAHTLSKYGMDSMIGAELRAWLRRDLGVDVPFMALLDQTLTFLDLANIVATGIESSIAVEAT